VAFIGAGPVERPQSNLYPFKISHDFWIVRNGPDFRLLPDFSKKCFNVGCHYRAAPHIDRAAKWGLQLAGRLFIKYQPRSRGNSYQYGSRLLVLARGEHRSRLGQCCSRRIPIMHISNTALNKRSRQVPRLVTVAAIIRQGIGS